MNGPLGVKVTGSGVFFGDSVLNRRSPWPKKTPDPFDADPSHPSYLLHATVLLLCLAVPHVSLAQQQQRLADPATWREVEAEMFEEINLLRSDPAAYAEQVLQPLKETLRRVPKEPEQPYEAIRILLSDDPIDFIEMSTKRLASLWRSTGRR